MTVETARWPRAEVVVRDDGTGRVTIDGQTVPVYRGSVGEARSEVMRLVMEYSLDIGLAVEVSAHGPEGATGLTVHPDGRVVQDGGSGAAQAAAAPQPPPTGAHATHGAHAAPGTDPAPRAHSAPSTGQFPQGVARPMTGQFTGAVPTVAPAGPVRPLRPGNGAASDLDRRDDRRSFVMQDRLDEPATRGVRGALSRIGLRVPPGAAERAERDDEAMVSQHWPGPRTISIVNGKGGAGKTPATALLSAVFSSHGGSGVVAWDNNQTRGTLGWRTEQGPHEATLLDLIPQTEHFLGATAQLADLAWFVHHQSRDRFDVLRSKPMALAHEQRISSEDVDAIHAVLAKYYRMIFIDSGNDESDPMWLRMIDHTDQLVVATSTRDDHAEAGALLLEALTNRGAHMAELARQALVVVSQSDPKATPADLQRVASGYRSLARDVVTIPFDPAMVDGQLVYRALRPATRRAWLAAGAAVAQGF